METQTAASKPDSNLATPLPMGLSSAEVAERMARGESNAVRRRFERTNWQIIRDNVFNLFNLVLLALVLVLLAFRDYGSIVFGTFSVFANSLIGTLQEIGAKRSLDRMAALAARDVAVWRDGTRQRIPIEGVVKDDLLPIEPGDPLCVDGLIVHSDSLELDESLLSGEADAIAKDEADQVYSGSYVIAGSGLMRATQVGADSTINKLSTTAKAYRNIKTPTQVKIDTLVAIGMLVILIFGPMVIISGTINQLAPVETVRNALVLVTSLVPQGLMLSTTVSLTLGAVRLSRRQALIQRMNAVESLAHVTVLCFDKTGTLTRNEMAVVDLLPLNGHSVDELNAQLSIYVKNLAHLNKTAAAIQAYAGPKQANAPVALKEREIPFSSFRKWGAVVFSSRTLILGAPERVLGQAQHGGDAVERARGLAAQGLRVLALAEMDNPPDNKQQYVPGRPLALIVLSDQVREDIQQTLRQFGEQQVELKVISGDNQETVRAIAVQAGLPVTAMYTGSQLDQMSDMEFEQAAGQGTVFARIEPATKRKIVAALKRRGAYVAMVGDGVNDVPALKEAHLAIAMQDGAQIAKDVADIVLLNNAISTLPLALAEGKKITQKIYATARLYLPKNAYQLLLFILAGFMSLPFPIGPIQISWFALLVVSIPTALIAFDLIQPTPVRSFNKEVLGYTAVSGLIGAVGMACLYAIVYLAGRRDLTIARSAVLLLMTLFGTIVFLNSLGVDVFRVRTIRQHQRSTFLGILLAAITIVVPIAIPKLFQFNMPPIGTWLLLFAVFGATSAALELTLHNRAILSRLKQLTST